MSAGNLPRRKPRIAVLGTPSAFTRHAVGTLCESGVPPVALVTGADSSRNALGPIPLEVRDSAARTAAEYGVSLVRVSDPNRPEAIGELERIEPDLLLFACLPRIVSRETRSTARLGALNLHPAPLPCFRGPDPVFWQLHEGVARTGVTVHVATDAVDAGPIVLQRCLDVQPGVRADALTAALVRRGVRALVEALPEIERHIREAIPQDESAATCRPRPRPEDFRLDASWTAERAYRFIEGTRGPATTFTIITEQGEFEVERALGFDTRARSDSEIERSREIATIRFADGMLRAVPARPVQSSMASSSSNPNVDMSRMRDG